MSDENTNIQNGRESTVDNTVGFLIEEGKKLAKEDFAKFSAIAAVIFSVGLWCIKSIWYAYWSGKFWVYKIDTCYINADSENVFLQIIKWASIFVVWFISNYIYYLIFVSEDKSKFHWKKIRNILGFGIVEIGIVFAAILVFSAVQGRKLIDKITVQSILAILILMIILCLIINIFAIEFAIEFAIKKHSNRKKSKETAVQENVEMTNEKRIKEMLFIGILTMAMIIIGVFSVSVMTEYDRKNYKVIMIQSEEETGSQFDIEYAADYNKYKVYPVVYENQDCYIVTRLCKQNGKIIIGYDYQKKLDKDEHETIYLEDVYQISGGK